MGLPLSIVKLCPSPMVCRQRTPMGAPSILPVEAAQWLSVARIVDIREKPEWSGLDGCLSVGDFVPAAALLEHVADWPRDEPVILVCRSGGTRLRCGRDGGTWFYRLLRSVGAIVVAGSRATDGWRHSRLGHVTKAPPGVRSVSMS